MSMKKSQWNVYACVDGKPISKQNKVPLTHWNATNMAAKLEKHGASHVLVTRNKPSASEPIKASKSTLQVQRVAEEYVNVTETAMVGAGSAVASEGAGAIG